jgi:hypothetical protein
MTNPALRTSRESAGPTGQHAAFGLLGAVALGVAAAMLFTLLSRDEGRFDDASLPPPPAVSTEPAGGVPDAATVFSGHDLSPESQPPSF